MYTYIYIYIYMYIYTYAIPPKRGDPQRGVRKNVCLKRPRGDLEGMLECSLSELHVRATKRKTTKYDEGLRKEKR